MPSEDRSKPPEGYEFAYWEYRWRGVAAVGPTHAEAVAACWAHHDTIERRGVEKVLQWLENDQEPKTSKVWEIIERAQYHFRPEADEDTPEVPKT